MTDAKWWPALQALESDNRITFGISKVWSHLKNELDFHEIREQKAATIAMVKAMDKGEVIDALNALARWGYIIEHQRAPRNVRRLTLALNVDPAKRTA